MRSVGGDFMAVGSGRILTRAAVAARLPVFPLVASTLAHAPERIECGWFGGVCILVSRNQAPAAS